VPMSASLCYTPSVPSLIPPVIFGAATLSITVSVPGWNFLRHFILQLAHPDKLQNLHKKKGYMKKNIDDGATL
ncbi:MAG: hypothetical protein IKP40_11635, partial [Clostridia bacterium]|nr:hypothetical protein [Clostridia bacterium]